MQRHFALGLIAASSTLALAVAAQAQTGAPAGQQAQAQQAAAGADLTVTANKREERIRNVAQSVTAVPQQKIEQLQAFTFADYAKFVPGLTIVEAAPGNTQLILRGVNSGGDSATVGIYVDETPYGSSSGLANGLITTGDLDSFDMQRVEVLRGPQGTLYGASTLGGLLKYVTNPPDPTRFAAEAELGTSETDSNWGWSAKGMVNIPLGTTAALRIVGTDVDYAPYIDDAFRHAQNTNGGGQWGVRGSLLWEPTTNLSIRLSATAQDFVSDDSNEVDVRIDPATGIPLEPLTPLYGDLEHGRLLSESNNVQTRIYNGTVNWNLGWANLISATSYGTYASESKSDATLIGAFELATLDIDKFTQEFRLASPGGQRFEWLAGFYYTHETGDLNQVVPVFPSGPVVETAVLTSRYEEEAVFGTVTYHFTPQFDVALGGRYANNDQTSVTAETLGPASLVLPGKSDDSTFTFSVAPRWRPTPDITVYGRVASGYQPGGPNDVAIGSPLAVPRSFGPSTVISWEAGVKADAFDHTLSFDVDAFLIDWRDIQLLAEVANTGVNVNGGTARSDGIEAQAVWIPLPGLTLSGNGAYTNARLTQNTGPLVGGRDGDPLPFTPQWSSTLDVAYNWTVNGDMNAFVGATWSYIGDRKSLFSPSIGQIELPNYNTWDARAGLDIRHRWRVELWARNIGDERGISSLGGNLSAAGGGVVGPGESVTIIRPRTIGITLTARY